MRLLALRSVPAAPAALLALAVAFSAAADRLEVYRPRGRPAAELAELLSGILSPGGQAIADSGGSHLLLRGEPEAVARALEVLRILDRPPTSYRLEATATTLGELRRLRVEVEGWIEAGSFRIGTAGGTGDVLSIWVEPPSLSRGERSFRGVLTLLEGRPAEIWTGTTSIVPVRRSFEVEGGRVRQEADFLLAARTGYRVTARSLADGRVDLEVAPVTEERVAAPERSLLPASGAPDPAAPIGQPLAPSIVQSGVATRLAVRPGELLLLGSVHRAESGFSSGFPAELEWRDSAEETVFVVRIEPLSDPAR